MDLENLQGGFFMKHLPSCRFYNPRGDHRRYQRWCRWCAKRHWIEEQELPPEAVVRCRACGMSGLICASRLGDRKYVRCPLGCGGWQVPTGEWDESIVESTRGLK